MSVLSFRKYLPKTFSYLDWVSHHVSLEQYEKHIALLNDKLDANKELLCELSVESQFELDENLFNHFHVVDGSPNYVLILEESVFDDFARVIEVYGQGCNYPTKQGVEGFQVDFDVLAFYNNESNLFHVVYQSDDRSNNLMAYSGFEMAEASSFGCDLDEGNSVIEYMDDDYECLGHVQKRAEHLCKVWLENHIDSKK